MAANWEVADSKAGVLTLRLKGGASGTVWRFLLVSDAHLDSIRCNREQFFADMERAKALGAVVLFNGDTFDAMQGRADPRRSMDDLREEYRRDDYYDFVVEDVARLLAPYARQIALIGQGNHESKVRQYQGTDLVQRLVYALRKEHNSPAQAGGYKGWVRLQVERTDGRMVDTAVIRYAHSAGGGNAPVTRGAIQTNRQAVYIVDADVVWNGHNHQGYLLPIARERLSTRGVVHRDVVWFVRTPGYKDEFVRQTTGWAVERGGGPTPLGSALLTVRLERERSRWVLRTDVEMWVR